MTASPTLYRRYFPALCGCLLVFFGARWVFQQDRRERLRDIPTNGAELIAIRDAVAYFRIKEINQPRMVARRYGSGQSFPAMVSSLEPMVVQTMPVTGGPARPLGEHRLSEIVFRRLQFTDDALTYFAYSEAETRLLGWQATIAGTQRQRRVGVFLARASLYALPLGGGPPVELLPGKSLAITPNARGGEPICVVGDKIYWLEIDPDKHPPNASASLKVATKKGGVEKTLLAGLSPFASLYAEPGKEGIVWIYAPPIHEISNTKKLYRLNSEDDTPRLFLWNRENTVHLSHPITLDGRVYWKRDIYSFPKTEGQDHPSEILSAAPDGSDSRVVYAFLTSAAIPSQLTLHAGKIYFEVYKDKETHPSGFGNTLMRLEPGAVSTAGEIFRFPPMVSQFLLDGEYLYYALEEERGQTTPEGSQGSFPVFGRVLCRYRLPP
jgi:hypothetical protein